MESDGSTTDEGKRKRDQRDVAEIFRKSKKVTRTPEKDMDSDESKLDKLMEMMRGLVIQVQHIEGKQDKYMEEMKGIKLENEKIKEKKECSSAGLKNGREGSVSAKDDSRRYYQKVHGDSNRNKSGETNRPNNLPYRTKEYRGQDKANEKQAKKEEYKKRYEEKPKKREQKIYINDDMTKEERGIQEKIRRKAKEERMKGKTVKIGFQKLIVEGERWRWNKEEENWNKDARELEKKGVTPKKKSKN
ncbi:hypothetical protein QE152_g19581 [Popillia japonica]|uniref:Uncharacterized protein n=1 Tax=Popillia japonica TaxID=7064 RepID=A0AAW1KR80_POPJA